MSWLYTIFFVGMMFSNAPRQAADPRVPFCHLPVVAEQQNESERIEGSYPINANGRVSVSNINGPIIVNAWNRNEVRLIATKTADTKERLADVEIRVEARPDHFSVVTEHGDWNSAKNKPNEKWHESTNVMVKYELSVPKGAVLNEIETVNGSVTVSDFTNITKVSAVNGPVRGTNLRGIASLSTVNGEVAADFETLAAGTKINLDTVNGRVVITLPSDSNAVVKAESLNGAITNDFGLPSRKGRYVGNALHGRLGSGGALISLESVNGSLAFKRRNDGKSPSPATNLLPPKGADEDEWDGAAAAQAIAETNREVTRVMTDAQRKAKSELQKELAKIKPEVYKIDKNTLKNIEKSIELAELHKEISDTINQASRLILQNANFMSGVPRIESKSDAIPVKGTPKITVDAKHTAVRVRGWDKQEVQYTFSQLREGNAAAAASVSENHSDSSVTIRVVQNRRPSAAGETPQRITSRIDVFVPRRSNLKIVSNGEIRLDGVSGDLEVTGGDEPINIRDSEGKLNLTTADNRARVIGFTGEVTATTTEGELYLEGTFDRINAKAVEGTIILTLPEGANADFTADVESVGTEGFELVQRGERSLRLGTGGPKYTFGFNEGKLIVRNSSLITK